MDYTNGTLFFFSALGAFNALVFSIYFLVFTRGKKLSNYFLGGLLLALSLRIGKSVLYYFNTSLLLIYLQIGLTACWFIGPALLFYIKAESQQLKKIPARWTWIILSLAVVILSVGIVAPYSRYPQLWNTYIIKVAYVQWGICVVMAGIELKGIIRRIVTPAQLKPSERWVLGVFIANLIIYTCYLSAAVVHSGLWYISGAVAFTFVLYVIALILLYRRKNEDLFAEVPERYAGKKLSREDEQLILSRLEKVMLERGIFKNPSLKLTDLAAEINVPAHQLSQLLNDNLGKGFSLFINEYRIEEACRILASTPKLTVDAVGDEVGFNSKSTFFSTFKKLKGITPAMYQQQAKGATNLA